MANDCRYTIDIQAIQFSLEMLEKQLKDLPPWFLVLLAKDCIVECGNGYHLLSPVEDYNCHLAVGDWIVFDPLGAYSVMNDKNFTKLATKVVLQ